MSQFYFGGSDNSDASDDDLPFPVPLPRASFLTPDFSPTSYLATLRNRHQTLEDLRSELRARSQSLSKELLDLVNDNYEDFLTLGASLKGGEEKVEEVRVGILGFQRDVEGVRDHVTEKQHEVAGLIESRRALRRKIGLARSLLVLAARLDELELQLMVSADGEREDDELIEQLDLSASDDSEDDQAPGSSYMSANRLQRFVQAYLLIKQLMTKVGSDHPFVVAQESRMIRIRQTLLLDLGTALKQAKSGGEPARDRTVKLMGLYREMGEPAEAVQILQQTTL
ncbi:MAG: hypothetical protein M1838_002440 [Thelocarpon superellum]|nr:MAG: hypothetical protein M1838_002440 [Thelocarpon superellum]